MPDVSFPLGVVEEGYHLCDGYCQLIVLVSSLLDLLSHALQGLSHSLKCIFIHLYFFILANDEFGKSIQVGFKNN